MANRLEDLDKNGELAHFPSILGGSASESGWGKEVYVPTERRPDISVIVLAHEEGNLAHHTMLSVWNAVAQASDRNIECEVLVVLDSASKATQAYFAKYAGVARILQANFEDAGAARNFGIQQADGSRIAFLDGGDLCCRDWLWRAFVAAKNSWRPCILHPHYTVAFDQAQEVLRHVSTSDPDFRVENLLVHNLWSSTFLADRNLLLTHPFQECPRGSGFGHEDWHWYCEAIASEIAVCTVDQTVRFKRCWQGARFHKDRAQEAICRPSRLFDEAVLSARLSKVEKGRTATNLHIQGNTADVFDSMAQVDVKRKLIQAFRKKARATMVGSARRLLPWRVRNLIRDFLKRTAPRLFPEPSPGADARLPDFPDWLLDEWKSVHAIEPRIFPAKENLQRVPRVHHDEGNTSPLASAYIDLCQRLPNPLSHVILVPWLRKGGADLEALNYVRALVENKWAAGIVVIATEDVGSPWANRLCGCEFVEFPSLYANLDYAQRRQLMLHFLIQKRPQVVHIINSSAGYGVFVNHGRSLSQNSRLYVHAFCDSMSDEGQILGFNRTLLPECIDWLTAVLSDNKTELERLCSVFPFPREKWLTHFQPVDIPCLRQRKPRSNRLEVLWAGRMDKQKRPDLLAKVAQSCKGEPIHFHVWGTSSMESDQAEVPMGENITYHGAFDGFCSLPVNKYDVFLYTSQFDGLPNILLEAMAAGLPVVASDVGGVGELVIPGETGILIRPFDDSNRYVEALQDIRFGRVNVNNLVYNAYELVKSRHNWEAFLAQVRATPGYTCTPPKFAGSKLRLAAA